MKVNHVEHGYCLNSKNHNAKHCVKLTGNQYCYRFKGWISVETCAADKYHLHHVMSSILFH